MATYADLITNALLEINAVAVGETPSAADANFALSKLNRMIDQWLTRSLYVYTISADRYTFPSSAASYTIGPVGAAITATRPTHITRANIVLTGTTPEVFTPLDILDDEQWASIRVRVIPVTIPNKMYNDYAHPNSTLYFWGYPTILYDLELWTWKQLTGNVTLATALSMPPGYEEAVTLSLAEAMAGAFGKQPSGLLGQQAAKARGFIQSLNSKAPYFSTEDAGMPSSQGLRSSFNYRTGNLR